MGRLGTLKLTVPARSQINTSRKMVQTRQNCRERIFFRFYAFGVADSITAGSEALDLNFFHQRFLSRDAYDRVLGRDIINGRSKLTSQRQFHASVRGRAKCIASVIASSTVGGCLGPSDRDKALQNITRAPGHLHTTERQNSLLRLLLGLRCFLN